MHERLYAAELMYLSARVFKELADAETCHWARGDMGVLREGCCTICSKLQNAREQLTVDNSVIFAKVWLARQFRRK